jgi:hypothetical protein
MFKLKLAPVVSAFALGALGALPARAETVILACSNTPGGPAAFTIDIDMAARTVSYPEPTPAQIGERTVVWQRPRYEPGTGEVRVAARYVLDRLTGQLRGENECLPQDMDWGCGPGTVYHCQAAKPVF